MEPDKKRIITSTEALNLNEIPKKMLVIGGGVIGLELGSVYARLGATVEVVEFAPSILPTMDAGIGKEFTKILKKEGFKFHMEHKVIGVVNNGKQVVLTAENKKGEQITLEADYCLVAVGRKAFTDGLNLDKAGLQVNQCGQVEVNEHLQTAVGHIYAIGDVVRGAQVTPGCRHAGHAADRHRGQARADHQRAHSDKTQHGQGIIDRAHRARHMVVG